MIASSKSHVLMCPLSALHGIDGRHESYEVHASLASVHSHARDLSAICGRSPSIRPYTPTLAS